MESPHFLAVLIILTTYTHSVDGCGLNHENVAPPLHLQQPFQPRLLQTQSPHPIQISGEFLLGNNTDATNNLIQTVFNISANYYSRVISTTKSLVTQLPVSAVTACNMTLDTIPSKYITDGFNSSTTDLLIFVKMLPNTTGYYVALATACVSVRRPIYGYMNINTAEFSLATDSNFQVSLQVIIHETAHVLGFGKVYFNNFYQSPTTDDTLPLDSVLRNISGRTYVITPHVMRFVQKYFNCNDNITGGLLEDQGTSSTALNHWERKVYYNQLMTSSALPTGMRISALTLSLLKDTNYYTDVDLSLSEPIRWGFQKGCLFARGQTESPPEFCNQATSPVKSCDFYSDSVSFCTNQYDLYANGASFYVYYSNGICNTEGSQLNQVRAEAQNFFIRYGNSSKCLQVSVPQTNTTDEEVVAVCYQSHCLVNGSIQIVVGNDSDNCIYPGQLLQFQGLVVNCPNDFFIFCSGKPCLNDCNKKGFCLRGACLCMPPYRGLACEITCPNYYDNTTTLCVDICQPTQFVYLPNLCVTSCPANYSADSSKTCQPTKQVSKPVYAFQVQHNLSESLKKP